MSAAMVKAHGDVMGGIIRDTMVNAPRDIKEKHLDILVSKTTGMPMGKAVMDGVITHTKPASKDVPELHKVAAKEVGKTKSKKMGQVPFAGPKY